MAHPSATSVRSDDVYAAPRAAEPLDEYDVEAARDAGYRPMDVRPRLLAGLFVAWAAMALVSLGATAFYAFVFDFYDRTPRTFFIDRVLEAYVDNKLLFTMPVRLGAPIVFLSFLFRAMANARALGSRALSFSPRGAVLWTLVPLANVVMTFRALREVWRATSAHEGDRSGAAPAALVVWWSAWLSAFVVSLLAALFAADIPLIGSAAFLLSNALVVVGAAAAAFTVSTLGRRMRARAANVFSEGAVRRREAEQEPSRTAKKARRRGKAKSAQSPTV